MRQLSQSVARSTRGLGISIRSVSRIFPGNVQAITKLSLEVQPGEFLSILGPSGCGKSTLLRIIADLDQADEGVVAIADVPGSEPNAVAHSSGRKQSIAYVFQDAHLLSWRTVQRNVALPLELMGKSKSDCLDASLAAIESVGLADAINRYPSQLSGGMRMRVSLARALVTDPQLLLLDEPFAALDEITRQKLDEQLYDLWQKRGMTVVFVTHSTAEAVYLAQRAVVFSARPARVVLDERIDLPEQRPASLRASPEFAAQTRAIYHALESASGGVR